MLSGRRAAERYRDRPAAAIVPAVADDQVFQPIGAAEAAADSAGLGRRQSVGSDAVKERRCGRGERARRPGAGLKCGHGCRANILA